MSFFSRSSRSSNGKHFRKADHGSRHYQRKGILGNLFNLIVSKTCSGGYYEQTPRQNQHAGSGRTQQAASCSSCGSGIPAGSKFCLNCGSKVQEQVFCSCCGEKVPSGSKFCLKCGNRLRG